MLTIDLEPELETLLNKMAQQTHCSPNKIIKQLIIHYLEQQQAFELLTNVINELPIFPSQVGRVSRLTQPQCTEKLRDNAIKLRADTSVCPYKISRM